VSINCHWHKINLACKQCDKELVILHVSTSADGEILIDLVCSKCGTMLQWVSTFTRLQANSIYTDIEESLASKEPKTMAVVPLKPPIADPKVVELDNKWLHDMGIGDGS
jgi:hypothetical protein